jgi:thioredoxin-dependent peroxiredoxin
MPKIGDQAPEFTLKNDTGAEVSLRDFKGKRVVLFFFPKANTPG